MVNCRWQRFAYGLLNAWLVNMISEPWNSPLQRIPSQCLHTHGFHWQCWKSNCRTFLGLCHLIGSCCSLSSWFKCLSTYDDHRPFDFFLICVLASLINGTPLSLCVYLCLCIETLRTLTRLKTQTLPIFHNSRSILHWNVCTTL